MDVAAKVTGNSLTASEFNQSIDELENIITGTGQSPSSGNLNQVGRGVADYSSHGDFYTDSGAADAYVLTVTGSKQSPTAYVAGFRARFIAGNSNTGASTVNAGALGVKSIKRQDGSALSAGDIVAGQIIKLEYDGTNFVLQVQTGGGLIQFVESQDGAVATGTTPIPVDSSIPQNTEGDEYLSVAITPTNASNKLTITALVNLTTSNIDQRVVIALFQDATADALAAAFASVGASSQLSSQVALTHTMTAGTTSSTTFKVRAGSASAGTTTFNGVGGVVTFGGVMASSITITEINV
jgi:hypothetical protein